MIFFNLFCILKTLLIQFERMECFQLIPHVEVKFNSSKVTIFFKDYAYSSFESGTARYNARNALYEVRRSFKKYKFILRGQFGAIDFPSVHFLRRIYQILLNSPIMYYGNL